MSAAAGTAPDADAFLTFFFVLSKALFSSKIFCKIDTVALSFVFDKYYTTID